MRTRSLLIALSVSLLAAACVPPPRGAAPAANVDKLFARMDTDNNGVVTADEQRRNAAQRFARIDSDNNRVIDQGEFDRAMSRLRRGGPELAEFAFDRIDVNNDGVITLLEYERSQMERFARMDANNDRVVTRYEFSAHMQQMMDRMQNRAPY